MKLDVALHYQIGEDAIVFRTISPNDVSYQYVDALTKARKYIENIPEQIDINKQRKYIEEVVGSPHDTICGLFVNDQLVGTAGIQNLSGSEMIKVVDGYTSNCTIGILVFPELRGKGYGQLLIWSSCVLSNKCCGITIFEACMKTENISSYKTFLACGFKVIKENTDSRNVKAEITDLLTPKIIQNWIYKERSN